MVRAARPAELVRLTAHALGALYGAKAPVGAPTLPQLSVLEGLLQHGPQTILEISALTRMDRSTLSEMLIRLGTAQLIARVMVESATPKSGRQAFCVSLTPRGRKALRKAETALWNAEVQLMARLTAAERAQFLNTLNITAYSGTKPCL